MLSQKQKNKLIRDLEAASTTAIPKKLRKKAQTVNLNVLSGPVQSRRRNGAQARQPSMRGTIGPSQRGISNVLGQRTDIPMRQPFVGSESLGRFNGSIGFTETQFAINPGQAGTFPWLSQEAKLWEKYEFDKLEFEFRTTINEFSANALGRVILGVDYDASDPAPSSRSQAEISRPVTAQAPYFNQRLVLKKEDMGEVCKYHYVRPGNLPGASDIKFYDVGVLNFGTDGNVNTDEVGELWVHYAGTFKNQVLESITTAPSNHSVASFKDTGGQALTSAAAAIKDPLATELTNGIAAVNTAGAIVLPAGNYLVSCTGVFTAATNLTASSLNLAKDGAGIGVSALWASSAASVTAVSLSNSCYFSSDGSNVLSALVAATGTGALAVSSVLTISSI